MRFTTTIPSECVDREVVRNAEQPWPEPAVRPESGQRRTDLDPALLKNVVRVGRAEHIPQIAVERLPIPFVKPFKCGIRSVQKGVDQLFVTFIHFSVTAIRLPFFIDYNAGKADL